MRRRACHLASRRACRTSTPCRSSCSCRASACCRRLRRTRCAKTRRRRRRWPHPTKNLFVSLLHSSCSMARRAARASRAHRIVRTARDVWLARGAKRVTRWANGDQTIGGGRSGACVMPARKRTATTGGACAPAPQASKRAASGGAPQ
ncbi:hypothetical protein PT2222_40423 [Paraburkholderia tropica]